MWSTRLASISLAPFALTLPLAGTASAPAGAPRLATLGSSAVTVGQTITLKGHGFVPGRRRDVVILQRPGARSIFIRADRATTTRVTVTLPACRVLPFLDWHDGAPRPTRFRVSVLGRRLSAAPAARSLTVLPGPPADAFGVRPGTSQCLFDLAPNPALALGASAAVTGAWGA
jgi:hypothetical protein